MERSPEREKARYSVTLREKNADANFHEKAQFSPLEEINLLPLLFLTR